MKEIDTNQNKLNAYRQIVKATTIFGGVQFFQILISIIKMKFVAILIGGTGIGIMGLFTTTTSFITSFTNFGLGTSAVKNIAEANSSNQPESIRRVSTILQRLVWMTGMLGLIVTLCLSPALSFIAFKSYSYTIAFIFLAPTLLITQISVGKLAILQGLRKIKFLSRSNLVSALLGLIIALPLFYFFGIEGIVPVLLSTAVSTLLVSIYYSRKLNISTIDISWKETWHEGNGMLKMGIFLNLSGVLSIGAAYAIRILISRYGGTQDVGYFTAGFTILNVYVGMLTSAIVADYYPRLAERISDSKLFSQTVNQQTEILILILAPIICVLLIFTNLILQSLYTKEFIIIAKMMQWASIGVVFRTLSWAISYIFIAKGDSKLFFRIELTSQMYFIPIQVIGYIALGLEGIGIAFLISYIIYMIVTYFLAFRYYNFRMEQSNYKIMMIQLVLIIICFLFTKIETNTESYYLIGTLLIVPSIIYSFYKFNSLLNLKDYFKFKKNNE